MNRGVIHKREIGGFWLVYCRRVYDAAYSLSEKTHTHLFYFF